MTANLKKLMIHLMNFGNSFNKEAVSAPEEEFGIDTSDEGPDNA